MTNSSLEVSDTGLVVTDVHDDPAFATRHKSRYDDSQHLAGMRRLAHAFVDLTANILQELVETALGLCGAESAGISLQENAEDGTVTYHWVATAGVYSRFLDAVLPARPSACGLCIERGRPQIFRVTQRFFDLLQVEAEPVKDGILLPWSTGGTQGTIWIISHSDHVAFDKLDLQAMELLADFAAMGVRQQLQRKLLMEQASAAAAAAMANDLAHQINNPLQALTNLVYLALESKEGSDLRVLAKEMSADLGRLSDLVRSLLLLDLGKPSSSPAAQ